MANTKIEWADRVWNPVVGCTPVSEGCAHCYAKRIYERFNSGKKFSVVNLNSGRMKEPLHWKKISRIFVNSMSDLFHPDVPDSYIDQVFAVMGICQDQTFMVLTKRPERMAKYLSDMEGTTRRDWVFSATARLLNMNHLTFPDWPLPNLWLGVTAENQRTADERIPLLLQTPAAVRFVSVEPMLGPVNIEKYIHLTGEDLIEIHDAESYSIVTSEEIERSFPKLDWVICGGETGPGARPMHLDWAKSLRDQCQDAGVPFFFKHWGEWASIMPNQLSGRQMANLDNASVWRLGKKTAGRELDGREWNEFPEVKK